jgi:hypothetical protein
LQASVVREKKASDMSEKKSGKYLHSPDSGKQGETNKINDLSEDLEYQGSLVASAIRCRSLGWRLAAVDARELVDLEVNFAEPVELWLRQCSLAGPLQGRVNLGVHTGSASQLMVLEVGTSEGESALDHCGSWRSSCRARVNGREQHYFTLPSGDEPPPTRFLMTAQVMVYGEEGLAPLPPSVDVKIQESWRWSSPPWEYPPPEPSPSLWAFLKQHLSSAPRPETEPEMPSWDEVYRRITPHEQLLKALLAPFGTLKEHYQDLLKTALEAGFQDRGFLLGLLWHAPQGDVSTNPERGAQLKRMVEEAKLGSSRDAKSLTSQGPGKKEPEESVLVSRSRFEGILGDLRMLMQKAAELEAVMLDWGKTLTAGQTTASLGAEGPFQGFRGHSSVPQDDYKPDEELRMAVDEKLIQGSQASNPSSDPHYHEDDRGSCRFHYSELHQKDPSVNPPDAVEAMLSACLQKNSDLAGDPFKLQMVQYCFKNYVNIDPELSDLSLQERLERASQMARKFLGRRGQE